MDDRKFVATAADEGCDLTERNLLEPDAMDAGTSMGPSAKTKEYTELVQSVNSLELWYREVCTTHTYMGGHIGPAKRSSPTRTTYKIPKQWGPALLYKYRYTQH